MRLPLLKGGWEGFWVLGEKRISRSSSLPKRRIFFGLAYVGCEPALALKLSYKPALFSKISNKPARTFSESRACLLIVVLAAKASIIAFIISLLRSGELENCSLLLLLACCLRISDSNNLFFSTWFTNTNLSFSAVHLQTVDSPWR